MKYWYPSGTQSKSEGQKKGSNPFTYSDSLFEFVDCGDTNVVLRVFGIVDGRTPFVVEQVGLGAVFQQQGGQRLTLVVVSSSMAKS